MKEIPGYLEKIIKDIQRDRAPRAGSIYTIEWLNEWIDAKKLEEKYGKKWETQPTFMKNHNRARGYLEAIGEIYMRKCKGLPDIPATAVELLSEELSGEMDAAIKRVIHRHLSGLYIDM